VFAAHPDVFDASEDFIGRVRDLFRFDLVHYTRDVNESKALNAGYAIHLSKPIDLSVLASAIAKVSHRS